MEVPLWLLRNTAYPQGRRLPKLIPWARPTLLSMFSSRIVCTRCNKDLKTLPRIPFGAGVYCTSCNDDRMNGKWGMASVHVITANSSTLGNIPETEFQFWVGERLPYSMRSRCRGCLARVLTKEGRERHMDVKLPKVACTVLITHASKALRKKAKCIVCNDTTIKCRWGIPLCGPKCIDTFKFDVDRMYLGLELELMNSRQELMPIKGEEIVRVGKPDLIGGDW